MDIAWYSLNINSSELKIEKAESELPAVHTYEIKHNGNLLQTIQGKETFFVIGKLQIYKSLEKPIIDKIRQIEEK